MANKNLDRAANPKGRKGDADGMTEAGTPRDDRRALRDERTTLRASRPMGGDVAPNAPADMGLPFDARSAWSQALHEGMASGAPLRETMAAANPMFERYNVPAAAPTAAPAPNPLAAPASLPGAAALPPANPMGALPPELAGMAAASPGGLPAPFGAATAPPPAASVGQNATLPPAPQAPPPGQPGGFTGNVYAPPSGGLAAMQRRPGFGPMPTLPNRPRGY